MIHPIQSFKAMPAKKKAAVVAGTVATAGIAASAVLAYTKGKKVEGADTFVKKMGEGYKSIGTAIKDGFNKIVDKIKNGKNGGEAPAPAPTPAE